jgi:hypothetical protein
MRRRVECVCVVNECVVIEYVVIDFVGWWVGNDFLDEWGGANALLIECHPEILSGD